MMNLTRMFAEIGANAIDKVNQLDRIGQCQNKVINSEEKDNELKIDKDFLREAFYENITIENIPPNLFGKSRTSNDNTGSKIFVKADRRTWFEKLQDRLNRVGKLR